MSLYGFRWSIWFVPGLLQIFPARSLDVSPAPTASMKEGGGSSGKTKAYVGSVSEHPDPCTAPPTFGYFERAKYNT